MAKVIKAGSGVGGISMQIGGFKELLENLKAIEPALQKKVLRNAMRQAAQPILQAARAMAPVDTGDLRRSLKIRAIRRSRKGRIGVVISTEKGFFKGKTFYAGFIEFGMPGRGLPARPFIRPAFDANKYRSIEIVKQVVKLGLLDVASGMKTLQKLPKSYLLPAGISKVPKGRAGLGRVNWKGIFDEFKKG